MMYTEAPLYTNPQKRYIDKLHQSFVLMLIDRVYFEYTSNSFMTDSIDSILIRSTLIQKFIDPENVSYETIAETEIVEHHIAARIPDYKMDRNVTANI